MCLVKGISICINDEHSAKALDPIDFTNGEIMNCFKDEHRQKVYFSIDFTELE